MDYSRRVDELQQRVAAIKAAVQAAATESREQLRQRDVAGIVITSGQEGGSAPYAPRRHRSEGSAATKELKDHRFARQCRCAWLIATARSMRSSQDERRS